METKEAKLTVNKKEYKRLQTEIKKSHGKSTDSVIRLLPCDNGEKILISFVRRNGNAHIEAGLFDEDWNFVNGTKQKTDDLKKLDKTTYQSRSGNLYTIAIQL